MSKTIKNKKRNRRLFKTKKYYGGDSTDETDQNIPNEKKQTTNLENSKTDNDVENIKTDNDVENSKTDNDVENSGVIDIINDKVSDIAETAGDFLKEKALRLVGLQEIDKNQANNDNSTDISTDNTDTSSGLSNLVSKGTGAVTAVTNEVTNGVANDLDKAATSTVLNLNEVLKTPEVQENFTEATQETAEIGKNILDQINQSLNDPETKKETAEALDNLADYTDIAIDVLNEPINKAVDELNEAGTKAASGIAEGAVKVAADALGAVPGFGAIVDGARMINNTTRAASSVVEAASLAAETTSQLVINGTQAIKKAIQLIKNKKNEAMNISNRTSEKIKEFQNPASYLPNNNPSTGGGVKKTKKRLFKRNMKSKRVRFSV